MLVPLDYPPFSNQSECLNVSLIKLFSGFPLVMANMPLFELTPACLCMCPRFLFLSFILFPLLRLSTCFMKHWASLLQTLAQTFPFYLEISFSHFHMTCFLISYISAQSYLLSYFPDNHLKLAASPPSLSNLYPSLLFFTALIIT